MYPNTPYNVLKNSIHFISVTGVVFTELKLENYYPLKNRREVGNRLKKIRRLGAVIRGAYDE